MTLELPAQIADKTLGFGESSYGVNRVTLVLADGRQVHEVYLAWGSKIAKIGSRWIASPDDLDFSVADIVDVISEVKIFR